MDLSNEIKNTRKEDLEIKEKTFKDEELEDIDAKELDFLNSDISGTIVGIEYIKGIIVNEIKVLELAKLMGIVIK